MAATSPRRNDRSPRNAAREQRSPRPSGSAGRGRRVDARRLFLALGLLTTACVLLALRLATSCSWAIAYLLAVSLTTVFLYGYDKRAAIAGRLRVPERTLHLWALAGGTPAAFASQQLFRHKTIKGRFRVWFWAIFALQVGLLAAWWYVARR